MEKIVISETVRSHKPREIEKIPKLKKRSFNPKKKIINEVNNVNDFVKINKVPNIKGLQKQVGYYKIGKSFHVFFEQKPNVIHRYFTKLFLGWRWHDQK